MRIPTFRRIPPISQWELIPCLFVLIIFAEFSWEYPDGNDSASLRAVQMLVKASFYFMLGIIAVYRFSERISIPRVIFREFGLFVALCGWFTLMSVQTATMGRSIISAACMVFCSAYVMSLFTRGDDRLSDRIVLTVKWATGFIVMSSCILAILNPDQFVLIKDYYQGLPLRLRGIMGHPNALARAGAVFVLIHYFQRQEILKSQRKTFTALALVAVTLVAMLLSQSRSSIVVTVAIIGADTGWSFIQRMRKVRQLDVIVLVLGTCVLIVGVARFAYQNQSADLASKFSRRGDASEVFELAGRVPLWRDVLKLAAMRPFTGYGLRAGETVLVDFHNTQDPKNPWVAPHAHNMYLEALLSGGYAAAIALLASMFFAIRSSFAAVVKNGQSVDRLCLAVSAIVFVTGNVTRGVMGVYFLFVIFVTFWLLASYRTVTPPEAPNAD